MKPFFKGIFDKIVRTVTEVWHTSLFLAVAGLIGLGSRFHGTGNFLPPRDTDPFSFHLFSVPDEEISLDRLREKLDVSTILEDEVEVLSDDPFADITSENEDHDDAERAHPSEYLTVFPPLDSPEEVVDELGSAKDLFRTHYKNYAKMTSAWSEVVTRLSECDHMYDAPGRDTSNAIVLFLQPIIASYLTTVDEEANLARIAIGEEIELITNKLKALEKEKQLLEKKEQLLKKNISRFSPQENECIGLKIERAKRVLADKLSCQELCLAIAKHKWDLLENPLHVELKCIVQSCHSGIESLGKVEDHFRKDVNSRLQFQKSMLNRLSKKIGLLEEKNRTLARLSVPDDGELDHFTYRSNLLFTQQISSSPLSASPSSEPGYSRPLIIGESSSPLSTSLITSPSSEPGYSRRLITGGSSSPLSTSLITRPSNDPGYPCPFTEGATRQDRFIDGGESSGSV